MKIKISLFIALIISLSAYSQNTFPSSGNVGIGTTTPSEDLEISGNRSFLFSSSSGSTHLQRNTPGGWAMGYKLYGTSGTELGGFGGYGSSDALTYYYIGVSYQNALMTIRPDGKVGIGTTSPSFALHINSPDNQLMRFTSTNGTWLDFESTNATSGNRIWSIGHLGTTGNFGFYQRDGTNQYRMILDKDGDVGIGTTNPSQQLHLTSAKPVIRLQHTSDGTPAYGWLEFFDSNSRMGYVGFGSSGSNNMFLYNEAGGHILIPNGYFGVGTGHGTPAGKVQIINGSQNSHGNTLILGSTASGSSNLRLGYHSDYSWIQSHGSKPLRINELGNNTILNLNAGSVGIGTASTFGYKLAVNGTIGATEVKVETTSAWPDFVFEKGYKLRTLKEVETFVAENQHLPEVPSEAEVTESGINLGEMDAKLLQKIEELTLYLIEQNKQIEELQKEVAQLKKGG